MRKEEIIASEDIFDGKVIKVKRHTVLAKNKEASREVVYHMGGASVVPVDHEGRIFLVRQYRIAYDEFLWEIPAGKIDPGEEPLETARRELEEECGLVSSNLEFLTVMYPSPGYTSEKISIYLARNLEQGHQHLDPDEDLEIGLFSFDEIQSMIADREIKDAKSLVGLLMAKEKLQGLDD